MTLAELPQSDQDALRARYARSSRAGRALRLLARNPRLIPYTAISAMKGAAGALKSDPTLGWLSSVTHVRQVSPDAILGAEWGGMEGFMRTLTPVVEADDVALEIGCGGGRVTRVVRPLVSALDAVDVSEAMLDEARRGTEGVRPIRFFPVDGFGDNLGTSKYDLVFSHDVFVHFEFDEVASYALNIAKALKPGGWFVVSVYTLDLDEERTAYREEIESSGSLGARRVRRMPSCAYNGIWETAGFTIEGAVRSNVSEYAAGKRYVHVNYQLKRV